MKEFIPVTDEMLYNNPQLLERLIPYHVDRPCLRLLEQPLRQTPADVQTDFDGKPTGNSHHDQR